MSVKCLFCNNDVCYDDGRGKRPIKNDYLCSRCGHVYLTEEAADDFAGKRFTQTKKNIISIVLRNEFEKRKHGLSIKPLMLDDLEQIVKQYHTIDPLSRMDYALINIDRATSLVGVKITIDLSSDYPYYHCFEPAELRSILSLLHQENFINVPEKVNPQNNLSISTKGYQRLRELKKPGKDSRQCFVAMWFTPEMDEVFKKAIKPAIEFTERGESLPRFEAIKIDNVEHINDINDEIIGQIRRSRFMVCDLTGYRGGVYFEAGFAYGLGLDVIYTCREDWTKEVILKDRAGHDVTTLYDNNGKDIKIKKESVHFDLAHRNRIVWSPDDLNDFQIKLENRIKAVIF